MNLDCIISKAKFAHRISVTYCDISGNNIGPILAEVYR
jgi:hypothetical protein